MKGEGDVEGDVDGEFEFEGEGEGDVEGKGEGVGEGVRVREGEVVREGEGGVEGMGKGKLRLMFRVRVSHDNPSDKRSKKKFFLTNVTAPCCGSLQC